MKKLFTSLILLIGGAIVAHAASYQLYVAGTQVTDANKDNIMTGVKYNSDSKTLTLTNAEINGGSDHGIQSYVDGLRILIEGYVRVKSEHLAAIRLHKSTTFEGNFGDLFVNESGTTHTGIYISEGGTLTIENLWLRVYGGKYAITGDEGTEEFVVRRSYVFAKVTEEGYCCIQDFASIGLAGSTYDYDGHTYNKTDKKLMNASGSVAASHTIWGRMAVGKYIIDPRVDCTLTSSTVGSGIASGTITWSKANRELKLDGVTMTAQSSYDAISFYGFYDDTSAGLYVWVKGTNAINTSQGGECFQVYKRDLTLDGQSRSSSVLTLNSPGTNGIIATGSKLNITTINLTVNSKYHCFYGSGSTKLVVGDDGGGSKITATSTDGYAFYRFGSCEFVGSRSCVNTGVSPVLFNASKKGFTYIDGSLANKVGIDVPSAFYDVRVCGVQLNNLNASNFIVEGLTEGKISWDNSTSTMTLNNVTLASTNPNQAVIRPDVVSTITISGTNDLSGGHSTIYPAKNLTINGSGSLYCDATTGSFSALYVGGNSDVTINVSGKVEFKGKNYGFSRLYSTSASNKLILKRAASNSDYTFEGSNGAIIDVYGGLILDDMDFWSSDFSGGNPGCYFDEDAHAVRQNGNAIPKLVNFYPPSEYYDLYVGGVQVTDCNRTGIGSKYIIGGGPQAVIFDGYSELTLNDANIDTQGKHNAIYNSGIGGLTIFVLNPSTINSNLSYSAIKLLANTTITGDDLKLTGLYGDIKGENAADVTLYDINIEAEGDLWSVNKTSKLYINLPNPGTRVKVRRGIYGWSSIYLQNGTRIESPAGARLSDDYSEVIYANGDRASYVVFADATPTGIENTPENAGSDVHVIGIFDAQGHQLEKMQPGVNILRMSDGTTQKVLTK